MHFLIKLEFQVSSQTANASELLSWHKSSSQSDNSSQRLKNKTSLGLEEWVYLTIICYLPPDVYPFPEYIDYLLLSMEPFWSVQHFSFWAQFLPFCFVCVYIKYNQRFGLHCAHITHAHIHKHMHSTHAIEMRQREREREIGCLNYRGVFYCCSDDRGKCIGSV